MLLGRTHIGNERICAVFPCIGDRRVVDSAVITTDEQGTFSLHRCNILGDSILGIIPTFRTFPAAIRAARKSQGWG